MGGTGKRLSHPAPLTPDPRSPSQTSPPSPADAVEPIGRPARSIAAFVLVTLVLIVALGGRLVTSPANNGSPTPLVSSSSPPADASDDDDPALRTYVLTMGGIPLSVSTSASGWERHDGISMNKSVVGPQGAEAVVFWASFPDGGMAHPCARLLNPSVGPTVADLAAQ